MSTAVAAAITAFVLLILVANAGWFLSGHRRSKARSMRRHPSGRN